MHALVSYSMFLVAIVGWWWARNVLNWRHIFAALVPIVCFFAAFPLNQAYSKHRVKSETARVLAEKTKNAELTRLCASWGNPDYVKAHKWWELLGASGKLIDFLASNKGIPKMFAGESETGTLKVSTWAQLDDMLKFQKACGWEYNPATVAAARAYLAQPLIYIHEGFTHPN